MDEFDDSQLLALLKNDSQEAYEILFKKYFKTLCLQAALLLTDKWEAEDIVIELFIEIWDKKIYRKIEQSFKAYLYKSVRNKCLNEVKRNRRLEQKKERYREYRQEKEDKRPSLLEQKESESIINGALLELPLQRLKAFNLVYLEKKKYQDAADEMGLSVNSVKTHLKLALKFLRNRIERTL